MKRIGMLIDGSVGAELLNRMLDTAPDALAALIGIDEPPAQAGCPTRRWADDTPEGHAAWLRTQRLDVLVLAWWPHLLRGDMLTAAPIILNTHPSLLPYCRGKDPNFWAIIEQAPFGVSLHHVTAGIDAGDIAFQREIPVSWTDTGQTLYERALTEMVALFEESLPTILHGTIPRLPQSGPMSLHYRRQLDPASIIDLDAPTTARAVLNRLRARTFPPHPGCRFSDGGESYEVRVVINRLP